MIATFNELIENESYLDSITLYFRKAYEKSHHGSIELHLMD